MEDLESSELGTKEFWEQRYDEEISNYENHGDPGEIWFGEDSVERVINWMLDCNISKDFKILDLGCGNGMFLIELARNNFSKLYGADYSENAINLAKAIADKQDYNFINYFKHDILEKLDEKFDIIHDKGTFDAICLSENAKCNRNKYLENICEILNDNGYFIITSCNWTLHELDEQFLSKLIRHETIPTPQFKFGGKVGNVVTTAIYKKK
ncbi:hypothetical protein HHI36_020291 [Cryptolaemus montrouzieri]|uniref:Protein-lysine N-methyltransferase HHI36_020291 n=1 Tax=Cryptolaemus montrouzieri TaxID=559131 RepID=A0ABD2NAI5_9CUCU